MKLADSQKEFDTKLPNEIWLLRHWSATSGTPIKVLNLRKESSRTIYLYQTGVLKVSARDILCRWNEIQSEKHNIALNVSGMKLSASRRCRTEKIDTVESGHQSKVLVCSLPTYPDETFFWIARTMLIPILVVSLVVTGIVFFVCWPATRKPNLDKWPPISDDEFIRRCSPGVDRQRALKVRRIVAEQLGVDYDRVYPEQRFVEDLGA